MPRPSAASPESMTEPLSKASSQSEGLSERSGEGHAGNGQLFQGGGQGGAGKTEETADGGAELYQCTICFEDDKRSNLVQACNCAATVHPKCLERWINTRDVAREEDRRTCEVCRTPYNLKIESKLGRGALCSGDSWSQYLTCVMMVLMFAMLVFVIIIYVNSEEYKSEENAETEWVLWVLIGATCVLFVSTLHKIYQRWRAANVHEQVSIQDQASGAPRPTPQPQEVQDAPLTGVVVAA